MHAWVPTNALNYITDARVNDRPLRRLARTATDRVAAAVLTLLGYEKKAAPTLRLPIPVSSSVAILPGTKARITSRPQRLSFTPRRLIIRNPDRWVLQDLIVGNRSQLAQAGDVPGTAFASEAGADLTLETVQAGMDLVVEVTYRGPNQDGEPFEAVVIGDSPACEDWWFS